MRYWKPESVEGMRRRMGESMDFVRQLEEQMQVYGVKTSRFAVDEESLRRNGGDLEEYFFQDYDYDQSLANIQKYCEEGVVYVLRDRFGMWNYSFLLPGSKDENAEMMHIGPILTESPKQLLLTVAKKNSLTAEQERELEEYYYSIPLIQSLEIFEGLLFLQLNYIYGYDGRLEINRIESYFRKDVMRQKPFEEETPQLSMEVLEERYRREEELLSAITKGDMEGAYAAQSRLAGCHLELRADYSTLREAKNMLLTSNTLYRKAVQAAAVHPMHIDRISRHYAKRIEESVFVKELEELSHEMIRKYCFLVRNHSLLQYSRVVRDALNYIDSHLRESISLKGLAEICNVSSSHLSACFKKEVGQSVVDYINEKRVFASLRYLATTDLSVAQIAERVGIGDENYFSRLFKKYQKRTPKQYRNLMRH